MRGNRVLVLSLIRLGGDWFALIVMESSIQEEAVDAVRFGVVSPGRWGRVLLESIEGLSGLELAGVCSRDPKRAAALSGELGGRAFDSYEEMLADDTIEAVVLPTPHFLHYEQAMAALQAGKHVFVEKPMANSLEEARELLRLQEKRSMVIGVGQQLRRTQAARKAKAMIAAGDLGDVALVRSSLGAPLLDGYEEGDWQLDPEKIPGGPLDNLAIHYIDLLLYWLGPVTRVCGFTSSLYSPSEVPSAAVATLFFESGVLACLATHQMSAYVSEAVLFGSKGALHFRKAGQELFWEKSTRPGDAWRDGVDLVEIPVGGQRARADALREELEDFARCILYGGLPEVGAKEGLAALEVVRAILESCRSDRIVELRKGSFR